MPPGPEGPNYFNFMQFLGNFGKILCWRPLPEKDWSPHLGEILDRLLLKISFIGLESYTTLIGWCVIHSILLLLEIIMHVSMN